MQLQVLLPPHEAMQMSKAGGSLFACGMSHSTESGAAVPDQPSTLSPPAGGAQAGRHDAAPLAGEGAARKAAAAHPVAAAGAAAHAPQHRRLQLVGGARQRELDCRTTWYDV